VTTQASSIIGVDVDVEEDVVVDANAVEPTTQLFTRLMTPAVF
jgi:hypothetical protein